MYNVYNACINYVERLPEYITDMSLHGAFSSTGASVWQLKLYCTNACMEIICWQNNEIYKSTNEAITQVHITVVITTNPQI